MSPEDAALESDALHRRVRAFVRASVSASIPVGAPPGLEPFEALALDVARFQASRVEPFARLLRARGLDPSALEVPGVDALPAVPTDVFRHRRVAAHPPERDARVFETSGTSLGPASRGAHAFRTLETYELASLAWGRRLLFPDLAPPLGPPDAPFLGLAPREREAPGSSLTFMLERFASLAEARGEATWVLSGGRIDEDALLRACARASGRPALVCGTSFAFVHLLEPEGRRAPEPGRYALPPGSRVMQTGGFKGRSREVPAGELRQKIAEAFSVPEAMVVGEYGMTELSSQLYEATAASALGFWKGEAAHGLYHPPSWVRVSACDPSTLELLPEGEVGIARLVDLANVDSALVIQTADRVRVTPAGVELLGRAPGASPRGCSIAIDEILSAG